MKPPTIGVYPNQRVHPSFLRGQKRLRDNASHDKMADVGRVKGYLKINGSSHWTLFDSGAENTYITRHAAAKLKKLRLPVVKRTLLGGKKHKVDHICTLDVRINNKPVTVAGVLVVDKIGKDVAIGRDFDILFGARAMQDWGIELILRDEKLDLSRYPGEFVEF